MVEKQNKNKTGKIRIFVLLELFREEMCDFRELETSSFPWNASGHRED